MRLLPRLAAATLLALVATPGHAARPEPAADCTSFTTIEAADGRTWEIRGFVCLAPGKPPKIEVTKRRETDPARALKQRLIW